MFNLIGRKHYSIGIFGVDIWSCFTNISMFGEILDGTTLKLLSWWLLVILDLSLRLINFIIDNSCLYLYKLLKIQVFFVIKSMTMQQLSLRISYHELLILGNWIYCNFWTLNHTVAYCLECFSMTYGHIRLGKDFDSLPIQIKFIIYEINYLRKTRSHIHHRSGVDILFLSMNVNISFHRSWERFKVLPLCKHRASQ